MKYIYRLTIALYIFLSPIVLAEQIAGQFVRFTAAQQTFGNAHSLRARAVGPKEVFSNDILQGVGGVLFQGVALPSNHYKKISFVSLVHNGHFVNIIFNFDGKNASYSLPGWMLIPLLEYSTDSNNALVTLFGKPTENEIYLIVPDFAEREKSLSIRLENLNKKK